MIYTIVDKDQRFLGFLRARTDDECKNKIKALPFFCKMYRKSFNSKPPWSGKQRRMKMLRGE